MPVILQHIKQLVTVEQEGKKVKKGAEMREVYPIENAFLVFDEKGIIDYGSMENLPPDYAASPKVDCTGRAVLPGYIDAHTHLVFAAGREDEYVQRIQGLTYEEIAKNGGGILNSAKKTAAATDDALYQAALQRAYEVMRLGTTAIEIKSGYGLTVENEMKLLRVARRLKETLPMVVKTTLLGAHALPLEFKQNREGFIRLVCNQMIPQAAAEGLADYVDVFCETGFFTPEETDKILQSGLQYGLKPRVHANELDFSGGVQAGVRNGALSVDHLECVGEAEIAALKNSATLPVVLPATAFFLNIAYAPARKMIDAGLPLAMASDYNPGTCPTGNLNLVQAIACAQMKLLPEEALSAVTLNAAAALELSNAMGSIERGKAANIIITRPVASFYEIPYYFGSQLIDSVYINGKRI